MASFHDSALGSDASSGTTLSTADALAVTAGDLVRASVKWETNTGSTINVDTGTSTPLFSVANAKRIHSTAALAGATLWWIATATGTINPRMVLGTASDFREIRAYSFTPPAGFTFALSLVSAADGNSTSPNSGTISTVGNGVAICAVQMFGSRAMTLGSGWTEAGEFGGAVTLHDEYQLITGGGNITGDGTIASVEWIAQLAYFQETPLGGARRLRAAPNKGPLAKSYDARILGFRQGIAPTAAAGFDGALMAAMQHQLPPTVIGVPSVVASGMTPPDQLPN